jgi:signal transduction histidine kinase
MKMQSGKYILPGWVCGGFSLILILWIVYELLVSYSIQRDCRHNLDIAVGNLIAKTVNSNAGPALSEEKKRELSADFLKCSKDDLSDLGNRTRLITYLFLLGCLTIFLTFLSWVYAIRNRELLMRIDSALDKKERIDELGLAAAGLAHETKNPLGVIRGLAQNIADNSNNDEATRKKARDIMEETDVTTARLGDFLSYARFRSPTPEEINSVEYLERVVSLVEDDFKNAGVELNTEITPLTIMADADMLSQVLINLLTNSLKFTKSGGIVTLSFDSTHSRFARIAVTDSGAGIDSNMLTEIFKPYVTKGAGGYGIGLAIVKRIVDQAGWKISVKSKLKQGTTITISKIPVKSDQA